MTEFNCAKLTLSERQSDYPVTNPTIVVDPASESHIAELDVSDLPGEDRLRALPLSPKLENEFSICFRLGGQSLNELTIKDVQERRDPLFLILKRDDRNIAHDVLDMLEEVDFEDKFWLLHLPANQNNQRPFSIKITGCTLAERALQDLLVQSEPVSTVEFGHAEITRRSLLDFGGLTLNQPVGERAYAGSGREVRLSIRIEGNVDGATRLFADHPEHIQIHNEITQFSPPEPGKTFEIRLQPSDIEQLKAFVSAEILDMPGLEGLTSLEITWHIETIESGRAEQLADVVQNVTLARAQGEVVRIEFQGEMVTPSFVDFR